MTDETPADRPELADAARTWLASPPSRVDRRLTEALTNFVENRYGPGAGELKAVHALRRRYFGDERMIDGLIDPAAEPSDAATLSAAAADSAPVDQGRLLYHLMRAFRPGRVLELGTYIGISAAYLAVGLTHGGGGTLTTIEASPIRVDIARRHFEELSLGSIETVTGHFDEVLPAVVDRLGVIDAAFVDGNHQRDATLAYFDRISAHLSPGGLVILDDIRWSEGMTQAWETISHSPTVAHDVDLGRTGLIVSV